MRHFILGLILLCAAGPATARWREATTTHFTVYSDGSADSAKDLATRLERFDNLLRSLRGMPKDQDPGRTNRLTVFILPTVTALRELYGSSASSVAGFFIPRAGASVAFVPRDRPRNSSQMMSGEVILQHEYSHYFMLNNFVAAYPAWYVEGFAEFHSTVGFEDDGTITFGLPAVHRRWSQFNGPRIAMDALMGAMPTDRVDRVDAFYGRSWLLTHYLTFEPSRTGQLSAYLANLNKGMKSLEAAKTVFGDLRALEEDLERYMRKPMPYRKIGAALVPIPEVRVRDLTPAEEAVMQVRIRSSRGVTKELAKKTAASAREAAAQFPQSAEAQVALAEAEYDAEEDTAAEAAADRAIAADPKNVEAMLYKGRVLVRRAAAAKADGKSWEAARSWLARANRQDPDNPLPLIDFYTSFGKQGIAPTANAIAGLQEAFAIAPHDFSVRIMLARHLLAEGKTREGRIALAPVAFSPHESTTQKAAAAVVAMIDAGTTDNLIETFDQGLSEEAEKGEIRTN